MLKFFIVEKRKKKESNIKRAAAAHPSSDVTCKFFHAAHLSLNYAHLSIRAAAVKRAHKHSDHESTKE